MAVRPTPPDLRTHPGNPPSEPRPAPQPQPGRLFLAPDHRPPLASEILALNVEDLDVEQRRAPVRSKGGDVEFVYWGTGTAHLLPRLLRLPDGTSRTRGPLFLAGRRPVPARPC